MVNDYTPCSPGCPGWAVFTVDRDPGIEIERCDECGRFACDEDAQVHVCELIRLVGERELERLAREGKAS